MAIIAIKNDGRRIEANPSRSMLVTLQMHDVPIQTICGGQAGCGKCVVRVLSGSRFISPKTPAEEKRLAAIGADETMRLACQSHPARDIEIEIINYLSDDKPFVR